MDYYYEEPQEPEESIYDWIKEEVRVPAKPARYVSKFSGKSQVTSSTLRVKKAKAATFGRPVKKEDPRRFLKAGSKMGKGVDPRNRASTNTHTITLEHASTIVHGCQSHQSLAVPGVCVA